MTTALEDLRTLQADCLEGKHPPVEDWKIYAWCAGMLQLIIEKLSKEQSEIDNLRAARDHYLQMLYDAGILSGTPSNLRQSDIGRDA